MLMHYIALEMLSTVSEFDNGLWIIALRSDVFHLLVGVKSVERCRSLRPVTNT